MKIIQTIGLPRIEIRTDYGASFDIPVPRESMVDMVRALSRDILHNGNNLARLQLKAMVNELAEILNESDVK